jgi:hypothetical protein
MRYGDLKGREAAVMARARVGEPVSYSGTAIAGMESGGGRGWVGAWVSVRSSGDNGSGCPRVEFVPAEVIGARWLRMSIRA